MRIQQLEKSFGNVQVLKDINLAIQKGERVAILGGNGSGKTTLLNLITASLKPTAGRIDFEDMAINNQNSAYIMQHETLPDELKLSEVLQLFAKDKAALNRGRELAEQFNLIRSSKKRFAQLSGGEKQKLLLISSLQNQPSYFFLDEITTGLDYNSREDLLDFLSKIFETEGATLFLVTHYIEEALRLCNRFVVIKDGRIIEDFQKEELLSEHYSLVIFEETVPAYGAYQIKGEYPHYKFPKKMLPEVLERDFHRIISYERDFKKNLGEIIEGA